MDFNSKKNSLIALGVTAVAFSRALFAFFNDPEGPNLLVVFVMSAFVYFVSWGAYIFLPSSFTGFKRLVLVILVQALLVTGLYFLLK